MVKDSVTTAFPSLTSVPTVDSIMKTISPAKPEFGDYQSNIALVLSKELKSKPLEVADKLKNMFSEYTSLFGEISLSGPGFINFKLSKDYVHRRLIAMLSDKSNRLGLKQLNQSKRVIVDFSSPNIAKEMHVGHLRSTIIGIPSI